jgi:methionyl-tRNA formyltransferase
LKIAFFGTPPFAASLLGYLLENGISICGIVTQPDRPKGRSLHLTPSAVKALTLEKAPHIPLFQPEKASEAIFLEELARLQADLFVVVAYGQILSQKLLDIPPLGCINVHASLLPKYRGAAPIHRCLIEGEKETGIAIQKMVRQLDAGDVISSAKIEIPEEMTFGELEEALSLLAKPLLLSVLGEYEGGIPTATSQDPTLATYASKVELEEGQIDWTKPARQLHNLIRAFSPRPGAWCWVEVAGVKKRLKIFRSQVLDVRGSPGEILSPSQAIIACGEDALKVLEVQPEGKKIMTGADWLRGQKLPVIQ